MLGQVAQRGGADLSHLIGAVQVLEPDSAQFGAPQTGHPAHRVALMDGLARRRHPSHVDARGPADLEGPGVDDVRRGGTLGARAALHNDVVDTEAVKQDRGEQPGRSPANDQNRGVHQSVVSIR